MRFMSFSATLVLVFLFSISGYAQEFKKFRVFTGLGYATGAGYSSAGILGTIEPGYRLSDQIALGLRGEIAGILRGDFEDYTVDVDVSAVRSLTLNGVYYFSGDIARPFAALGGGVYWLSGFEYSVGAAGPKQTKGSDSKLGVYPRIGVELGHLSFTIDYNIIPKTKLPDGAEFKNSYLAIRLGFFFGGGRKNKG